VKRRRPGQAVSRVVVDLGAGSGVGAPIAASAEAGRRPPSLRTPPPASLFVRTAAREVHHSPRAMCDPFRPAVANMKHAGALPHILT
jgi:hypothetical protein